MSYLSATENVGFTTQTTDSCATQYKMAVDGVQMDVDVNSYMNDNSINESSFLSHYNNDNFYHSKFKIDPNELYTFHDSDIITNEVTVDNTEDYVVTETVDYKEKTLLDDNADIAETKSIDNLYPLPNGILNQQNQVKNGNLKSTIKKARSKKVTKTIAVKVEKIPTQTNLASKKEIPKKACNDLIQNARKPKAERPVILNNEILPTNTTPKLNTSNVNHNVPSAASKPSETFLDVFKRELNVKGILADEQKTKTESDLPVPPLVDIKVPAAAGISKKASTASKQPSSSSRHRRGRGPTVHEALQRIPKRAIPVPNRPWHAPEHELFNCGPLTELNTNPFKFADSSGNDDEHLPDLGVEIGCVEEITSQNRGTRLALRRAALRRQLAKASTALSLVRDNHRERALAAVVSNQLKRRPSAQISPQLVNHLLIDRGMTSLFTSRERRKLRLSGWSGGESLHQSLCSDPSCSALALPCTTQCLNHVIKDPTQRLFKACGAVFSDGGRCTELLSPLSDQPLCQQHQWKKDNYDKQCRETKQRKPARPRNSPSSSRRVRRRPRRRLTPNIPGNLPPNLPEQLPGNLPNVPGNLPSVPGNLPNVPGNLPHLPSHLLPNLPGNLAGNLPGLPATLLSPSRLGGPQRTNQRLTAQSLSTHNIITTSQSLSDLNTSVCSNSSAYESGDEATIGGGGALSETEFIVSADEVNELVVGEVGHVHADDILDPAVLSQIPDEAFTEFFNQAEGGATFAESSELTRALEAVLDERALDTLADCVVNNARSKLHVPASIGVEMSSSAPS